MLLVCFSALSACATEQSAVQSEMSRQAFDEMFAEISNWGRWGKADELGTLNLITPAIRARAAALVREGVSVSLARELDETKSPFNPHPFERSSFLHHSGHQAFAMDTYAVQYHGATHSHIDALAHVLHNGELYNGVSADSIEPDGASQLGVHNMKDGVVTRGVLVDLPWLRGVDYLEPGEAIRTTDLEAWEAKTGIRIGGGDVLLVRTGRWARDRKLGTSPIVDGAAGLHVSVARWLKHRGVAGLGADGGNDVIPSGVEGTQAPLHELAVAGLGMPLFDALDLDALAAEALKQRRWEFLFIAAPLRVEGGTGAPINPLAVF